jgi:hypothetical protein
MTQGQEGRKHQQMNEVWNLWQTFLQKIVERHARKYHKVLWFHQCQYPIFWQTICRKEKFVPDGFVTTWLLNRNRKAWNLKHYWNKHLTLKVKHSCIRLSLLMKRGLETLNWSWNCNQWVEKSELPATQKISMSAIEGPANDELCLWSPMNNHDRVPCGTSVTAAYYHDWLQKLCGKMHSNWPDLLGDGPLILHDTARLHLGKVVTVLLSKYEWEVLPHMLYSPGMSTPDFDLFHKLEEPMHGHCFPSLEEVSALVTWALRGLNKSTLNGITNLPKCWDAVIESQGDYIWL